MTKEYLQKLHLQKLTDEISQRAFVLQSHGFNTVNIMRDIKGINIQLVQEQNEN